MSGKKRDPGRGFVNASASWNWDWTGRSLMEPSLTRSRTRWQSISICLVRSWKTGLDAIWIAAWLSQNRRAGWEQGKCNSERSRRIQGSSLAVAAKARYSTSAEDREIVVCFLAFQDIDESPRKMQKPVVDFRVSGQDPQSASENALSCKVGDEEKNYLWLGTPLI